MKNTENEKGKWLQQLAPVLIALLALLVSVRGCSRDETELDRRLANERQVAWLSSIAHAQAGLREIIDSHRDYLDMMDQHLELFKLMEDGVIDKSSHSILISNQLVRMTWGQLKEQIQKHWKTSNESSIHVQKKLEKALSNLVEKNREVAVLEFLVKEAAQNPTVIIDDLREKKITFLNQNGEEETEIFDKVINKEFKGLHVPVGMMLSTATIAIDEAQHAQFRSFWEVLTLEYRLENARSTKWMIDLRKELAEMASIILSDRDLIGDEKILAGLHRLARSSNLMAFQDAYHVLFLYVSIKGPIQDKLLYFSLEDARLQHQHSLRISRANVRQQEARTTQIVEGLVVEDGNTLSNRGWEDKKVVTKQKKTLANLRRSLLLLKGEVRAKGFAEFAYYRKTLNNMSEHQKRSTYIDIGMSYEMNEESLEIAKTLKVHPIKYEPLQKSLVGQVNSIWARFDVEINKVRTLGTTTHQTIQKMQLLMDKYSKLEAILLNLELVRTGISPKSLQLDVELEGKY